MNAVDVTLMTSHFEGSPVAIKESLARTTPVVSVPVGDLPELLDGLPGCAVVPRDPVLLANAVLQALECGGDSALRQLVERLSALALLSARSPYKSVLASAAP
jgi:glycosyltransferase involved in cell wall biosynthesis